MRAARISEHEADAAAARWGYARPLAEAYETLARREVEPSGRLARLHGRPPAARASASSASRGLPGAGSAPTTTVPASMS